MYVYSGIYDTGYVHLKYNYVRILLIILAIYY